MNPLKSNRLFGLVLLLIAIGCQPSLPEEVETAYHELPEEVDFNFHIRPILSDRCYSCHGPDDNTREAELRLDDEASAFAKSPESGAHPFVKGSIGKSAVWQRIMSEDPNIQMPPPESHLSLSAKEKALITKWIEQGAKWKTHWAFIPPEKPAIPKITDKTARIYNPIDNFILKKLEEQGLSPSPEAEKERLIRRLSFDLTGLPPKLEEIDDFLADDSPKAYEKLVDRLLNSDAYGERMALEWMDVARYADSHGLHADGLRVMWPWRDWVINAFQENLPYNDFVTWQLAGDLLPNANREQKLATAFHRNHTTNSESGIVSEEYRLKYVADRTNTTATAFMGLTMECATCHDHKFDPISQKEYYQMSAFFNQVKELGMIGNELNFGPMLMLPKPQIEEKLNELSNEIKTLSTKQELTKSEIASVVDFVSSVQSKPIQPPRPDGYYPLETITNQEKKQLLDRNKKSFVTGEPELVRGKKGKAVRIDADFEQVFLQDVGNFELHESFSAGAWINTEKKGDFQTIMGNIGSKNSGWRGWVFFLDSLNRPSVKIVHKLSHNYLHIRAKKPIEIEEWNHVFFTYDGSAQAKGLRMYLNGAPLIDTMLFDRLYKTILPVRERTYKPDPNRKIKLGKANNYLFTDTDDGVFKGSFDEVRIYHQYLTALEIQSIYQAETELITQEKTTQKSDYLDHYLNRMDVDFKTQNHELAQLRGEKYAAMNGIQEVMVMEEMPTPRKTHILDRGQYDALGEEVNPGTPSTIFPFSESYPKNRLGLAQWLFDKKQPLTARVAVNRYWQMIFGQGIVDTPHDFGSQGSLPSHPELLDWLAVEFQDSGWNVKALLRKMVTSATYRQATKTTEEHQEKDAKNVYLARGPHHRLQAEMIRDNALAASGLLSNKIGGESVKPYQPEGLWKDKNNFSEFLLTYKPDSGANLYRKSIYTFIRRTSPPPTMLAFDATARDVCLVKRENTQTPLQALILLNDPQFVEAARVLAQRMQQEGGKSWEDRVKFGFRLMCGRLPNEQEMELMKSQFEFAFDRYKNNPKAATELLEVGEYAFDQNLDEIETAAFAMVANTMMNFDEAYMKR